MFRAQFRRTSVVVNSCAVGGVGCALVAQRGAASVPPTDTHLVSASRSRNDSAGPRTERSDIFICPCAGSETSAF